MLQEHEVLAFDLGASSGRALVGRLVYKPDGAAQLHVEEVHRFSNGAVEIGEHLYWDILRLLDEVKQGFKKAFKEGYRPKTFGIDTWGVDFGLLDHNDELIGNPYHYRDPQSELAMQKVVKEIGRERLFAESGLQLMPFNTIFQLAAMKQANSPKLELAHTLLLTPDLLTFFLTGKKVCEFTMATTTQLFNPVKQSWNVPLMKELGIPSQIFLEVVKPGTMVGPLTVAVCKELNISSVEAVAVGTHDTESAVVAVPVLSDEPFAYLVCGTWSLIGTELQQPILSEEAASLDFSNEGGVGDTYQLLKNIMGLWILQQCVADWKAQGEEISYPELIAEASLATPFRSLIDPDDLRFYSPHGMVERIQGYCAETNQHIPESVGEVTRCVLESLALRYKQAITQLEQLTGNAYTHLYMVGGGIQNELLCQLTANALERTVIAGPVEASVIGNMLVQLISSSHCSDLSSARQLVAESFELHQYEAASDENWQTAYDRFTQLQKGKEEKLC